MKKNLLLFILTLCTYISFGQKQIDLDRSIPLSASYADDVLTIHWERALDADAYTLSYRTDVSDYLTLIGDIPATDSTYTFDSSIDLSNGIEVSIKKQGGETYATGYLYSGKELFAPYTQPSYVIIVESSIQDSIAEALERYIDVVEKEAFDIRIVSVSKDDSVPEVKDKIIQLHTEQPIDYLLLLGNIPVPYSGDNAIDGHYNNHKGAWVFDAYYSIFNGNWTDATVDNTTASREANHNVPGDGKFDQSYLIGDVEIMLGRVDLSRLPKFSSSEAELTIKYLNKNIAFRTGLTRFPNRGLIDNNFNLAEGFGQGSYKSFRGFFHKDSVHNKDYSTLKQQPYLWSFGAGGGNYKGASGIINTNQLSQDSVQTVFTTIFGSYFGDWDNTNNLLRASLASGNILTNAWNGRPVMHFHHMAMGKTIGQSMINIIKNTGQYYSGFGNHGAHISLLGDPTLKMYYSTPISDASANASVGQIEIIWEDSEERDGYAIYGKKNGQWIRISGNETGLESPYIYESEEAIAYTSISIRPLQMITNPSGSYYTEGAGFISEVELSSSLEEIENAAFSIFPNPSSNMIFLRGISNETAFEIYNVEGRKILQGNYKDSGIDISQFQAGVYFLQANNHKIRFVKI